jgi:hypothetical protein
MLPRITVSVPRVSTQSPPSPLLPKTKASVARDRGVGVDHRDVHPVEIRRRIGLPPPIGLN